MNENTSPSVELVIEPQEKDLGEFKVRRVLPAPRKRMIGPFVFFDHMGPAEFPPGEGVQVRPHPHIGLATVTYLFEGQIMHRDSLGVVQSIEAGAVNLMTAGRGIVHSERAGDDLDTTSKLHGIQSWMALPEDQEEVDPAFVHYPASTIPEVHVNNTTCRVIIGTAFGQTSPVEPASPTLYLELKMPAGAELALPDHHAELACYVVSGAIQIDSGAYTAGVMAIAHANRQLHLHATADSHIMVIGGQPLGHRHLWWNFVSSSKERIEQAGEDWQANRFDPVPGEDEFIPLPRKS